MGGGRRALIAATILLCSCVLRVQCDAASAVSQEQEIRSLRSKVASLEDEVSWTKDETSQLEDVVREKTAQIAALASGLEALQVRNVADDESVVKPSTSNPLLEKQIERLGSDLEDQLKKGESLEAQASEAERRLLELGRKLERVEKVNVEQRRKIKELEHDLQHSEVKLSQMERRAKLMAEELAMVRGMWLPYWFASRSLHCQVLTYMRVFRDFSAAFDLTCVVHLRELASAKWHLHGKPVLDALTQKVAVTLAIQPCMLRAQEFADRYWKESMKLCKPYMARIAAASEPHLARARVVLQPYMRPVTCAWTRLVRSTSTYHTQVQRGIIGYLEDTELLNPHSADGLAWWTASALFALPMFVIYKIFLDIVRKKIQARPDGGRSGRSSRRKHTRRVEE